MEENFFEEDFKGFVEDLITSGRLDDKEIGISKRMLDKGYDSLSDKQKYVFNNMIKNNSVEMCQRCDCRIPWSEMLMAIENGGYCSWCQHMMEKSENE